MTQAGERFEGVGDTRPYQGAAAYYAQHRRHLSDDFVAAVAAVMGWTPSDRVLDLGTGPGQIALRLARGVGEVVAVDPEPDMLEEGRRRAREQGIENVVFVQGSSDDLMALGEPAGQFRAVTIGEAFHWMLDQDRVVRELDGFLDPVAGAVLLVNWDVGGPTVAAPGVDLRAWREREPWAGVERVLNRYLASTPEGPHPRGRHDPFEQILGRSAFPDLSYLRWEYEREVRPSADAAIGYWYSISHVLARLGGRREAFEAEVRDLLRDADNSAVRERAVDSVLIGRRRPA